MLIKIASSDSDKEMWINPNQIIFTDWIGKDDAVVDIFFTDNSNLALNREQFNQLVYDINKRRIIK